MPSLAQSPRPLLATFAVCLGGALRAAAAAAGPSVIIESFTAGGHKQSLRLPAAKTSGERGNRGRFDQSCEPALLPARVVSSGVRHHLLIATRAGRMMSAPAHPTTAGLAHEAPIATGISDP